MAEHSKLGAEMIAGIDQYLADPESADEVIVKVVRYRKGGAHPDRPKWRWCSRYVLRDIWMQLESGRRVVGGIDQHGWNSVVWYCKPEDRDPPGLEGQ